MAHAQPALAAAAAAAYTGSAFRVLTNEDTGATSVEVDEASGNGFHLGPVLRKYTAARMQVKGARRFTTVETSLLYDALGLLRSLQYDVAQFNSAAGAAAPAGEAGEAGKAGAGMSANDVRYACYRLTRQAAAFGVRVPRPGAGTVSVPGLPELIAFIEAAYADRLETARALVASGIVDFASLAEFFRPGVDLVDRGLATGMFGVPTCFRVRAGFMSRGKGLLGTVSTFFAALECVVAVGDRFAVVECSCPIADFPGTRSTREGGALDGFVELSPALAGALAARGEQYARLACGASYLEYQPGAFMPVTKGTGSGSRTPALSRGSGRIMIDSAAAWARGVHCARSEGVASDAVKGVLKLVAQRERTATASAMGSAGLAGTAAAPDGAAGQAAAAAEEEALDLLLLPSPLPPRLALLAWPVVPGFSFSAKCWGVAQVAGLRDIRFQEDAFQRLVMPPARKRLIEALVLSHGAPETSSAMKVDVMEGKGEGTILLLHGPPGVGKTLTAESIAELLHKPLYSISMGELGTTPEALEERLADVVDLCTPWGALILIDEAEMLLERRGKGEVLRNALVCVMLRVLERVRGILFLTTNRIESLDPAFQSRVQCALRYEDLDDASRAAIWRDLLSRTRLEQAGDIQVPALAAHVLNGRQIKNTLQLAIALAQHERVPLAMRHLEATLEITTAFMTAAAEGST